MKFSALRALREYVQGVLVCDAYAGYDELDRTRPQLVRSGCMAHARRKVFEAKEGEPDRALILLALIRQLYDHEELIQKAACTTRAERHALALGVRQEKSRPVMGLIEEHVKRYRDQVLPKSPMGKALGYLTNQWTPLSRFLEDGAIPIDNNLAYAARGISGIMPRARLCRANAPVRRQWPAARCPAASLAA